MSNRPTSPHLQIYRWNISSITSIMHRATGVVLYFSILALSWYLTYYTYEVNPSDSAENCDCPMNAIFENIFSLAAIAVVFSLYYHLCNGIRHLNWDLGRGLERAEARRSARVMIAAAVVIAVVILYAAFVGGAS